MLVTYENVYDLILTGRIHVYRDTIVTRLGMSRHTLLFSAELLSQLPYAPAATIWKCSLVMHASPEGLGPFPR